MFVQLKNDSGHIIKAKIGFSWTTLFFGFFVPLFRKDWLFAAMFFLGSLVVSSIIGPFSFFISIGVAIFYNELYIRSLLNAGYYAATADSDNALRQKGYY